VRVSILDDLMLPGDERNSFTWPSKSPSHTSFRLFLVADAGDARPIAFPDVTGACRPDTACRQTTMQMLCSDGPLL
jgi:hypothetical protein